MNKVIISAAVTGGIHTPGMTPYLPITPDQIIVDAINAANAGAASVHIHARDPEDGKPTSDIGLLKYITSSIQDQSDVIVCVTTGGNPAMTVEERIAPISQLKPELASCNAGSLNFMLAPAAKKLDPIYEWERPFLENTKNLIFSNTFTNLEHYITVMNIHQTKPEFEVYDVGMINNIAYFIKEGLIKPPVYIQFIMGILGGIPATVDNLTYLVKTAKEQLGDFQWSVAAAGKNQFRITTAGLTLGGHVRVGLEDSVYIAPKKLAQSSAEQVTVIREIAEKIGLKIATPAEARVILSL